MSAPRSRAARAFYGFLGFLGEILITLGILCFLFFCYESFWTNIQAGKEQSRVDQQLTDMWSGAIGDEGLGDGSPIGRIYIPSFGSDWKFTIVKGVNINDLAIGPGWYTNTQKAGEVGNFALAGHRVGHGSPFNDLGYLNTCNSIVIETQDKWFVYRVLPINEANPSEALAACMSPDLAGQATSGQYAGVAGRSITTPGDVAVVSPVPNQLTSTVDQATLPMLTLTTCHPQFDNRERMIVHGVLTRVEDKTSGQKPVEITTGA